MTLGHLKNIIENCYDSISNHNFSRSTGQASTPMNLESFLYGPLHYAPRFFKNKIPHHLRDKVFSYLCENSISSRERTDSLSAKTFREESWLFHLTYDDLLKILGYVRLLYIPVGSLCAILIFGISFSSLGSLQVNPSFQGVSFNIQTLSGAIRYAGSALIISILAYIISIINSLLLSNNKTKENLSEAIFQLKASNIDIEE